MLSRTSAAGPPAGLSQPEIGFAARYSRAMTVPSRGARGRRGNRVPGWPLLTGLLILAIAASSTLVFTDRVELLRLAVILSLWAAVVAAFVTVVYRRQSELDQARARDMKFVYDLQLDREISARREYELSVETNLRRQLARELRAQAAEEMSALRSELESLRSHLEVLLGSDLGGRPALQGDRGAPSVAVGPGRVESSRISVVTEEVVAIVAGPEAVTESSIIDVPEEPLAADEPQPPPSPPRNDRRDYRGNHRQRPDEPPAARTAPIEPVIVQPGPPPPGPPWRPPEVRRGRHSGGEAGPRTPGAKPVTVPEGPRGRHSAGPGQPAASGGRHRDPERQLPVETPPELPAEASGQHTGGQSVAELMARLQVNGPAGGGGRRRRED